MTCWFTYHPGYVPPLFTSLWHILHDDVIKWKHFPRYWPFVRGIHRSPVNSPHKGQWCGPLMFTLICVWINDWVNNREAGDLRRYRAHYDVTVMDRFAYFSGVGTSISSTRLAASPVGPGTRFTNAFPSQLKFDPVPIDDIATMPLCLYLSWIYSRYIAVQYITHHDISRTLQIRHRTHILHHIPRSSVGVNGASRYVVSLTNMV